MTWVDMQDEIFEKGRAEERLRNLFEMLSRGGTEEDLRKFHDASDEEIAEAKKMLAYA